MLNSYTTAGLQADDAKSCGYHQALGLEENDNKLHATRHIHVHVHLLVRGGHSLEDLEAVEGLSSTLGLVVDHSAYGTPEDAAGGTQMVGTTGRVGVGALAQESKILHYICS